MMLNELLAKILIGLIYLGIILLFAWVWKKFKKNSVAGGTVGFFIGIIPIAMLLVLHSKAYIVQGNKSYSTYWTYGSCTYLLANDRVVEINSTNRETTVINDSPEIIEIEEIVYGSQLYMPKIITLASGDKAVLDSDITYFFDDHIPNQIEVEYGKYAVRNWLREF